MLLCVSACSKVKSNTTISYSATPITTDEAGDINQGRPQTNEAVFNDTLHESSMDVVVGDNKKVGITIKLAAGETAQVTLHHNEQAKQLQMTEGQIKDVVFDDSDVGVRIHVKEIKK